MNHPILDLFYPALALWCAAGLVGYLILWRHMGPPYELDASWLRKVVVTLMMGVIMAALGLIVLVQVLLEISNCSPPDDHDEPF